MKIYDKDIRPLIFRSLVNRSEFINNPETVVINELDVCFGNAIIDVAAVNGEIYGFEIKSEQDSLERLPSQARFYAKVFNKVSLVASEKHCSKAKEILPSYWGIDCVYRKNGCLVLENIRPASLNQEVDTLSLLMFLWKNELLELFYNNGITKGIKSKTRIELAKKAAKELPAELINNFVKHKLKSRKGWKALRLQQLCDDLHLL